jgi:hypothetical protein
MSLMLWIDGVFDLGILQVMVDVIEANAAAGSLPRKDDCASSGSLSGIAL